MTYKRFPNTGTIMWRGTPTTNSTGYVTPGTLSTIWGACSIQETRVGSYVSTKGGDSMPLHFDVIWNTKLNTVFAPSQFVEFNFGGATYTVLKIHNYQKHTEFQI